MTRHLALATLLLSACWGGSPSSDDTEEIAAPDPTLVLAHTSGMISRTDAIRVQFARDMVDDASVGKTFDGLSLSPAAPGEATWLTTRELQFKPSSELQSGTHYTATADVRSLVSDARPVIFEFDVLAASFHTETEGLDAGDNGKPVFRGVLRTADKAEDAKVESMLTAKQANAGLSVTWAHDPGGRSHRFTVSGITRQADKSTMVLAFDGTPIGALASYDQTVDIPPEDEFSVLHVRAVTSGERFIRVRFSDPLDAEQDLRGLIRVSGQSNIRLVRDGNSVRIYHNRNWSTSHSVSISGVRNAAGKVIDDAEFSVSFEALKPAVAFEGTGVILPTTANLTVPITVSNVSAVTVEALRVFDTNVPQFLQVNELDGSEELHRVGEPVWSKRVEVEMGAERRDRPVRMGLDLSQLVAANPNGLYHLRMRFERGDIVYNCASSPQDRVRPESVDPDWEEVASGEASYWDNWQGDDDSPWESWQNRENPCHAGYYRHYDDHDITVTRNVLVSNVGLVAKQGQDHDLVVLASDVRTTEPLANATVTLYDYRLQPMDVATTDGDGRAVLTSAKRPFAVGAAALGQSAWLRLSKGSALSMAHFDTSGDEVQEGLKGYLYGERGVWRPGDDIHLTFVLHDELGVLPNNHPVHFELKDPRGHVVVEKVVRDAVHGFYDLQTTTRDDAPTGAWLATVTVGGSSFTRSLRVETVVPNRLKIDLDLPDEVLKGPKVTLDTTLSSRWLHGAIAGDLETSVQASLRARSTTFAGYDDFVFHDPTASVDTEATEIFKGRLDDEGVVDIEAKLPTPSDAPGMLTATLSTRVFEPSGAASIQQSSIAVSPHARYVGIKTPKGDVARGMLLTDTEHPVEIAVVDADGKPAGNGAVDVALYKVSWRWWWEKGTESFADYAGSTSMTPVSKGTVQLKDGKGTWGMQINYPEWGRYLLVATDRDGTHRAGKVLYIDWPGWAGRGQADNPGGASVLSVTADKDEVSVGDDITIRIPTSGRGRVLVSLETATSVLDTLWVRPTGDTTTHTFKATRDMAPNVFAHVTYVQPHEATGNDLPTRLYGVVPIEVTDPKSKLTPTITMADELEPRKTASISVSESKGRAMTYTLAVVDEGLLGLTRFETPDPWDRFYAREALGVRTWDTWSHLAGATGGALEGLIAVGGDGENNGPGGRKRNRFAPVVEVLGPFDLAEGATAKHDVPIGAYVGEVRVMVVAGRHGAYGSAEQSVPVRKPLMVLATVPRVLGPKETFSLPVDVFAMEKGLGTVTLTVKTEGPITVAGDRRRTLSMDAMGNEMRSFELEVGESTGNGLITVVAEGGGKRAEHTVPVEVRNPMSRMVVSNGGAADAGKTWLTSMAAVGMPGTQEAYLELSRTPPMDLGRRLDSLIRYPHGCVEQTTSSVFPQVYLTSLMSVDGDRSAEIRSNIAAGIDRLRSFQHASGGFGYWVGAAEPQDWATSYAGHFLLEAERAGHLLPPGVRDGLVRYQRELAGRWVRENSNDDLDQAYRLYTLALAGEPEMGAMNRLRESDLSSAARWRLASAYQLAGQPEVAKALVGSDGGKIANYTELSGTFGSALRDQAMVLEAMALQKNPAAAALAQKISTSLVSGEVLSTQETSWALIAMARFAGIGAKEPWTASWSVGSDSGTVSSSDRIVRVGLTSTAGEVSVKNTGAGTVFARLVQSGMPPVAEVDASAGGGLSVAVSYRDSQGNAMGPEDVAQGTDFTAFVTVTNSNGIDMDELAISQILPSGWEVHGTGSGKGEGFDWREVRDDRVYTYFDLPSKTARTFEVGLHSSFLGDFFLPPVQVEAMYDETHQARSRGEWVEVSVEGTKG